MDKEKYNNLADEFKKHLQNMTPEQKAEMEEHFRDKAPKGWVDIEKSLPQCTVEDYCEKGYSVYKVKDKDGKEFQSAVTDHSLWYYEARAIGITHWWNVK